MRANGLCPSALVLESRYANVPDVEYLDVVISSKETWRFAQTGDALLPELLRDLAEFRKAAKKDMKTATGDLYNMYNAKQLAFKISMNRHAVSR